QDISNWDVSNVTDMGSLFYNAFAFNQDISGWDVGNVTIMYELFANACTFNADISNWDVSSVTNMYAAFLDATDFNQDISSWNVSNVTNMENMFWNDAAFNQNIGTWDISNVSNMTNMFQGVTLSTANYDALLIGWSAQTVQSGVTFSGGDSKYSCNADAARAILTNTPYSWIITDGGNDLITIDISTQPNTQNITEGNNAVFSVVATGSGTLAYQWRKDEVNLTNVANISGALTNELTLTGVSNADAGAYDCVVSDGCGEDSTSADGVLSVLVAISELSDLGISIYPNPTSGKLTIKNEQLIINNLEITDITGKTIFNSQFSTLNSQLEIDLSSFESGIYLISIQTDKEIFTTKIIKK
ncbi:MAG: BspA family leucine-rich repeat surface protein, partial [Bacteroidota bacterium]|nr:BspA family leucine-rich repeat surface protein [Bacteroidota bacterium]